MQRRSFISALSGGVIAGTSGCISSVQERISGNDKNGRTLGEQVEHRGITVAPDKYATANTVTYDIDDTEATPSETAPEGATYLFTHLSVEHTGENERVFPSRGHFSGSMEGKINHFYRGEHLDIGRFEDSAEAFQVNGQRLSNYSHVLLNNNYTSGVYAGEASGWLINEIPKDFNSEKVTIEITWGGETFTWVFSSDAQQPIGQGTTESREDGGNITIDM